MPKLNFYFILFSHLEVEEWKVIKIIENEMEIKKGTLVTTLDHMKMEFKLTFEVKATSFLGVNSNILHFTLGDMNGIYGTRIPLVRLATTKPFLKVCSSINGVTEQGYAIDGDIEVQLNEWIYIEITQTQGPVGYIYSISMNGNQLFSIINNQPETFYNVLCYVSGPWKTAQPGFVRNLYYYYK